MDNFFNTPFGDINILLDNKQVEFEIEQIFSKNYPEVTAYNLKYNYIHDNKNHILKCILNNTDLVGEYDGGERLTAITFESNDKSVNLNIGVEGEFYTCVLRNGVFTRLNIMHELFDGSLLDNGIEIEIENDNIKEYIFRIAWMCDCKLGDNEKVSFMADPTYSN